MQFVKSCTTITFAIAYSGDDGFVISALYYNIFTSKSQGFDYADD